MGRRNTGAPRGLCGRRLPLALCGVLAALALIAPAGASGQSGGSVQPRIVGGSPSSTSTYPWQAAVVFSKASPHQSQDAHQRQFCGGSLITSRIVITAAHCVYDTDPDCSSVGTCLLTDSGGDMTPKIDPNDVSVVLGYSTLSTVPQSAEFAVDSVTYQSNYNPNYQNNGVPRYDVAYLVLHTASGQPLIKIAGTDEGALWDAGSPVEISGWGSTNQSSSATVDTLRAAGVDVLADSSCTSSYGADFDFATMVCAGFPTGGVDTCYGDSGGPLEAPLAAGGYRLVGITGWGNGCGQAGFPGVYTRVASPTMRSLIQSDVSALPSGSEGAFGSGGQPRNANSPSSSTPFNGGSTRAANAVAKCRHIRNKKKRRRCIRRAKALVKAQA